MSVWDAAWRRVVRRLTGRARVAGVERGLERGGGLLEGLRGGGAAVSLDLVSPNWWGLAIFRSKNEGFVPRARTVSLALPQSG